MAATAVAATTAVGAGPASAHDGGHSTYQAQHKGPGRTPAPDDKCVFTVDGKAWTPGQGLASIKPSTDGRISIGVAADGGNCTVSLAAYLAQGPDFASSGQQVLSDFSTVSVKRHKKATLTVAAPTTGCFAQIDLYKGSTEYDGKTGAGHGPAPHGPSGSVIGANLLASWNGPTGGKDCTTTTPPTSPPASSSPTDSASPSSQPSDNPSDTPSDSASASASASASSSASSSAPAVGDTSSPSPSATGSLAHTGGGNDTGLLATLAVVLVALGGAVTFVVRRRGTGRAQH